VGAEAWERSSNEEGMELNWNILILLESDSVQVLNNYVSLMEDAGRERKENISGEESQVVHFFLTARQGRGRKLEFRKGGRLLFATF
jgi:hypothetical protein